jgi:hypothetical protein
MTKINKNLLKKLTIVPYGNKDLVLGNKHIASLQWPRSPRYFFLTN